MKILLDAGHGGNDSGATGCGVKEKDLTLKLTMNLGGHLTNLGHEVFYTRTSDETLELKSRAERANQLGVDYFFSVHLNSGGGTGSEVWLVSNASGSTKKMGQSLLSGLTKYFKSRGVKLGYVGNPLKDYAVNRDSNMPSALIEVGFIDNQHDVNIVNEQYVDIMCSIATSFTDYVNSSNHTVNSTPTPTPPTPPQNDFYNCNGYRGGSIVDGLKSIGVDSSKNNRKAIANKNGIGNYVFSAEQNNHLLSLFKDNKLRKV